MDAPPVKRPSRNGKLLSYAHFGDVVTLAGIADSLRAAAAADPFGCLASGTCPDPAGPLPAGTSAMLFLAVGLVAWGVAVHRLRRRRPPAAPTAGSS